MELTIRDDVGLTTWGSGSSNGEDPINTYYHDSRAQFIVLASELDGADGNVVSLSLYINELPGRANLQDFRIRIKHTSATTTTAWEGGWTDCFGPTSVAKGDLTTGEWNKFVFGTPFEWDGTSNLMIDISRDDFSWTSNGGSMRRMINESNRMFAGRCDGCTLYANTSGTTSGSTYDFIPAIKLEIDNSLYVDSGRFVLKAGFHGNPWLARVDAGRFALKAELRGGDFWLARLDAGRFELDAGLYGAIRSTSGGTITYDGDVKVHTFAVGTTDFVTETDVLVEVLLVAGGGGAGRGTTTTSHTPGAGGAGGLVHVEEMTIPAGTYSVVVGAGGAGSSSTGSAGTDGGDSILGDLLIAKGGGGGGSSLSAARQGRPGGSGGGGGRGGVGAYAAGGATTQAAQSGLSGTAGHGMDGRASGFDPSVSSGGGGGAGGEYVGGALYFGGTSYTFHGTDYAQGGRAESFASPGPHWMAGGGGNGPSTTSASDGGTGGGGIAILRVLPPPEDVLLDIGHIGSDARIHGNPWLARVDAGMISVYGLLTGNPWLARVDAGPFTASADLHADPLRAYPMPRFVIGADQQAPLTSQVFYQTAGRFDLESALSGTPARIVWWQDPRPVTAQQVYTCILTGHQDSTTDLALPMSSFQFRLYHHGGSYLSIVVPNAVLYAPQIAARLGGQLVVRQGYRQSDGTEQLAEMARAGQITLRHDTGARNSSATITAGESITFSFDPGVVKKVTKLINRTLQADGNWQFRTPPIFGLFPGDSVEIDGTAWNVNRISVAVGKNMQTMDILSNGPS